MKRTIMTLLLSAAITAAPSVYAQHYARLLPKPSQTLLLYPEGQDSDKGLEGAAGPGESNGITAAEETDQNGHIRNVGDNARVDLYFPKKPNGQMIVVCPGGGYWVVSTHNEGGFVADWLVSKGFSVAVVTYRLPNGHWNVPMTDVRNVIRYCRSHAEEWGIKQVGVMGYSAGGHLAASVSTLFTEQSVRPDFSILIYPVISFDTEITHIDTRNNLLGYGRWHNRDVKVDEWEASQKLYAELTDRFSLERQVSTQTPPTFLAHSTDDRTVAVENSLRYYSSLVEKGVPAEMHIYPRGGHGWGFRSEKFLGKGNDVFVYARKEFETSLLRWLESLR